MNTLVLSQQNSFHQLFNFRKHISPLSFTSTSTITLTSLPGCTSITFACTSLTLSDYPDKKSVASTRRFGSAPTSPGIPSASKARPVGRPTPS